MYLTSKGQPLLEPQTQGELAALTALILEPLNEFTVINLNLFQSFGNNPVSNFDPLGLDFSSCYANCMQKYRDPTAVGLGLVCNAGLNKLVGPTGRSGFQGVKSHSTSWQHKLGSNFGSVGSKIGRLAGRAATIATVADGFFDLGLLGGCAAACAGE